MPTATDAPADRKPVTMEVEDGVAVIRLDQPGKPVNVLSADMAGAMDGVLRRLEAGEGGARAAVIVSDKPGVWIAGADIEQFTELETADQAEALSRGGQEMMNRIERLKIPVVAAIDGAALGGGLEVALACGYRIASDSPKTKLGLPEVQLGILPGAGGTQRLPRLVGIRAALDLMLTGKQLDAKRAQRTGLVDEVVPAAILRDVAVRVARELADGTRPRPRGAASGSPQWVENLAPMRTVIFRKAREGVTSKTRGLYPAPLRILEVVENSLGRELDEGLAMEARAFGELAVTPEARALVHLFFVTTAAKNDPELEDGGAEPRDFERVAVVGAGFMGAGIAAVSAQSGLGVRLKDVTVEAAAKGLETARGILEKRAKRRRMKGYETTQLLDRVAATAEYTGFGRADVVVEAVFEEVGLKHRVLREIEEAAPDDVVLGSNTSTIPIATLAEGVERPENVIGLHFFSPVEKMPLLEIIVHEGTSPEVTATAHAYGKRIGKTPVVVNDAPGFYVNRILTPYMAEAALLLEEGVRMEEIDRAMTAWGFPVGPVTLYDEVGLDVAFHAGRIMAEAFAHRMRPSPVVEKMVEDGRKGRKNGRGFFLYENGEKKGPDPSVYALIGDPAPKSVSREEIQERLALTMVNEAMRTLEEGVLRSARDGDVGAVMGIGFPPFRGGPFWYVDTVGADEVTRRLRGLAAKHGPRFEPAELLVERARERRPFFGGGE